VVDTDDQVETVDTDVVDTDIIPWVDTDVPAAPWVDTDLPRLPLEQQTFHFTETWAHQVCGGGSCLLGFGGPDGEVESFPITCTDSYPGEVPGTVVCAAYMGRADGTIGSIQRKVVDPATDRWSWEDPTDGHADLVSAGVLYQVGRSPDLHVKLQNLEFVDLDGDGVPSIIAPYAGGMIFNYDFASSRWTPDMAITAARVAVAGPNPGHVRVGYTDVDGNGLIDLLSMKSRRINPSDPSEPTGLTILYQLPGGQWEGRLYGRFDGHNEVYEWLLVSQSGGPPVIIAAGSSGPGGATEVYDAQGVEVGTGFPLYAESMMFGSGIGSHAPMGGGMFDLTNRPIPTVVITDASRDLCYSTFEESGGWWFDNIAIHREVFFGALPFPGHKCADDVLSPDTREIPWGQKPIDPDVWWTSWGNDQTEHERCGPARLLALATQGIPAPIDCAPVSRPTISVLTDPTFQSGEIVNLPHTQVSIFDQDGFDASWGNKRAVLTFDLDDDGDPDVLEGGAYQWPTIFRNDDAGPRFCVQLRGRGYGHNDHLGTGSRIEVTDLTTAAIKRLWTLGSNANCFRVDSRDPTRTQIQVIWRNGATDTQLWDGQSTTVPFTE
jgi:hypothetical protein